MRGKGDGRIGGPIRQNVAVDRQTVTPCEAHFHTGLDGQGVAGCNRQVAGHHIWTATDVPGARDVARNSDCQAGDGCRRDRTIHTDGYLIELHAIWFFSFSFE